MIIFVADAFLEHYTGGAELTTESIIEASLFPYGKVLSQQLNLKVMKQYKNAFWIFGNFANVSEECLVYAAKNLKYNVLEYDYKYCIMRSPEKHILNSGSCNCSKERRGKIISIFLNAAKTVWWMSEKQKKHCQKLFPFLENKNNQVLSSVFSRSTLEYIKFFDLDKKDNKWIILNSPSWIKGVEDAVNYAKENNLEYELVWGLKYEDFLEKLSKSRGLIFLPKAGDTCPRMVIEAKLLGCELILNDNVQHKDEPWFVTRESAFKYLEERQSVFWDRFDLDAGSLDIPIKHTKSDIKYNIVVPFYNAQNWLEKCIYSIQRQKHTNFECTLIDDVSDDKSFIIAKMTTEGDDRFRVIQNKEKSYALENIAMAIETSNSSEEDVVVLLDGDDWFSSSLVLSRLNKEYKDKDCLMTYGSYILHPHAVKGPEPSEYPDDIIKENRFREDQWRASHLRTFKKKLWNKISHEDLQDKDGNYYTVAYDQAIMLPLLEMARERSRYIPDILHVYNKENPLSVDKIKTQQQVNTAKEIRKKKRYKRLS
jgi:hypothetical protein